MGYRPAAACLRTARGAGPAVRPARQPGTAGPRRVRQDELRDAFRDGWAVASIEAAAFELNQSGIGIPSAQAWLAVIHRSGPVM